MAGPINWDMSSGLHMNIPLSQCQMRTYYIF